MSGWIKIHRPIKEHWIWNDPVKLKWWLIMIMDVNYSEGKLRLGNEIFVIGVGQSAKSLRSWADSFECGTKAVINFFNLLEKDGMITKKTIGKGKQSTTLINIGNYNQYQGVEETLKQRKGNARATQGQREGHTIKEGKESKEEKEIIYRQIAHLKLTQSEFESIELEYFKKDIDDVLDSIENYSGNKKYISLNLTCRNWLKKYSKKTELKSYTPTKMVY